jgi:hypothetical protein
LPAEITQIAAHMSVIFGEEVPEPADIGFFLPGHYAVDDLGLPNSVH